MSSKTKITGMKNLTKPQNLVIFVCVEPLFGCYLNLKLFGQKKLIMHEIEVLRKILRKTEIPLNYRKG